MVRVVFVRYLQSVESILKTIINYNKLIKRNMVNKEGNTSKTEGI